MMQLQLQMQLQMQMQIQRHKLYAHAANSTFPSWP